MFRNKLGFFRGSLIFLFLPAFLCSSLPSPDFALMRRLPAFLVLCAWLLASGAQWDVLQGFAWGRMIATYSRTMPVSEAIRLTFTPDNLCGFCSLVASASASSDSADAPPADPAAKSKPPLATPPAHLFVFSSAPAPRWPAEQFHPVSFTRPAPPTEPPRWA
jgi:hypothetical protein